MAALSNSRRERFAQAVAEGSSASEAYAAAGYKPCRQAASRLLSNVDVQARIAELQERNVQHTGMTVEKITQMLIEDRKFAREHKQAGPASQATERLARLHGLYVDRSEIDARQRIVTDQPMTAEDWEQSYAQEDGDVRGNRSTH